MILVGVREGWVTVLWNYRCNENMMYFSFISKLDIPKYSTILMDQGDGQVRLPGLGRSSTMLTRY